MPEKRLAIDIGGTFADFVLLDEETGSVTLEKEPSPREKLTDHIFKGMGRLDVDLTDLDMVIHGSTVVINTILQEVGSRIGLITTLGFRDVLGLGRGNRPEVYNLLYKPPTPLIPRYLRLDVPERLDHNGNVITPLDEEATRRAIERLKARGGRGYRRVLPPRLCEPGARTRRPQNRERHLSRGPCFHFLGHHRRVPGIRENFDGSAQHLCHADRCRVSGEPRAEVACPGVPGRPQHNPVHRRPDHGGGGAADADPHA